LHAKSGLRFSIRDDIHGESVRIWAKSVLNPDFTPQITSFCKSVLQIVEKKISEDAAPWAAGQPTGLCLFFFFFRRFAKTLLQKLVISVGVGINPPESGAVARLNF